MTRATKVKYTFTAEDIVRERDEKQQPWKEVAEALGLGGTTAARAAYRKLTGRAPSESQVGVSRAPRAKAAPKKEAKAVAAADSNPHWNADSDQDEIIERLNPIQNGDGKVKSMTTLVVQRNTGSRENVTVMRLLGFKFNSDESRLMVELTDAYNGAFRCFYVDTIVEVY